MYSTPTKILLITHSVELCTRIQYAKMLEIEREYTLVIMKNPTTTEKSVNRSLLHQFVSVTGTIVIPFFLLVGGVISPTVWFFFSSLGTMSYIFHSVWVDEMALNTEAVLSAGDIRNEQVAECQERIKEYMGDLELMHSNYVLLDTESYGIFISNLQSKYDMILEGYNDERQVN